MWVVGCIFLAKVKVQWWVHVNHSNELSCSVKREEFLGDDQFLMKKFFQWIQVITQMFYVRSLQFTGLLLPALRKNLPILKRIFERYQNNEAGRYKVIFHEDIKILVITSYRSTRKTIPPRVSILTNMRDTETLQCTGNPQCYSNRSLLNDVTNTCSQPIHVQ